MLLSCGQVQDRSELIGSYEMKAAGQVIYLDLRPSGNFIETLHLGARPTDKRRGKWFFKDNRLGLDGLWIPRSFAPDYILEADSEAETQGHSKYTDPGYWSIMPEKEWGTLTLTIFPDADISFKKISRDPSKR